MTDTIANDPTALDGLHVDTLLQLNAYAAQSGDYRVLDILVEAHTGISLHHDRKPTWFISDFSDDVTEICFEHQQSSKTIRWCDIVLDDGERLSSPKHTPLLNAFKHWIIACDDPLENGGKVISSKVATTKVDRVVTLINTLLLNSAKLKLSQFHLQKVNDDFWLNTLLTIAQNEGSVGNALYQVNERAKAFLDNVVLPKGEVEAFKEAYPHVIRDIAKDDLTLNLKDRAKACCWLYKNRFYACSTRDKAANQRPKGINRILNALLFEGKILHDLYLIAAFPELEIKKPSRATEYKEVANTERGSGTSSNNLSYWVSAIRLIHTNLDKDDACSIRPISTEVNVSTIEALITLRKMGRTRTLPPEFVFDLFRKSYEFVKSFCPAPNESGANLLTNMLSLLAEASVKSAKSRSNPHRPSHSSKLFDKALHGHLRTTELAHWLQLEAINAIDTRLIKKGIQQLEGFGVSVENRHERIRNNESMFELFTVLQGAIQLLTGAIMARRQNELFSLKISGNLIAFNSDGKERTDIDPYSEEGEKSQWSLRFKVKKTGVQGKNVTVDRPIPLSIARFVWQLEQFNEKAKELGLNAGQLSLFNNLHPKSLKLYRSNSGSYNDALDALCDYFETSLVQYDNGECRRNYIRQHQLRRFFALVFFWSKGYENMEALRWMLAHSDVEHLYHYITESEVGAVVNSAKSSVIIQSVISDKSQIANKEEIEKLRKLIAERVSGDESKSLVLTTVGDAAFDYEDPAEYHTVPHITQLQLEQDLESEVLTLLETNVISLEPEFFTIQDEDGTESKTFNLILKVNELEG